MKIGPKPVFIDRTADDQVALDKTRHQYAGDKNNLAISLHDKYFEQKEFPAMNPALHRDQAMLEKLPLALLHIWDTALIYIERATSMRRDEIRRHRISQEIWKALYRYQDKQHDLAKVFFNEMAMGKLLADLEEMRLLAKDEREKVLRQWREDFLMRMRMQDAEKLHQELMEAEALKKLKAEKAFRAEVLSRLTYETLSAKARKVIEDQLKISPDELANIRHERVMLELKLMKEADARRLFLANPKQRMEELMLHIWELRREDAAERLRMFRKWREDTRIRIARRDKEQVALDAEAKDRLELRVADDYRLRKADKAQLAHEEFLKDRRGQEERFEQHLLEERRAVKAAKKKMAKKWKQDSEDTLAARDVSRHKQIDMGHNRLEHKVSADYKQIASDNKKIDHRLKLHEERRLHAMLENAPLLAHASAHLAAKQYLEHKATQRPDAHEPQAQSHHAEQQKHQNSEKVASVPAVKKDRGAA